MLFNSIHFAVFFPVVTVLYFALPHRARWAWLLAASSYFYCVFIPAYILILGFTIVVDYAAGLLIERAEGNGRRLLLAASIAANVGVLGLFKYYDFAATSLATLAASLGVSWRPPLLLGIALPLGLSFHTFQAMSYTIEVYRGRQRAERHFGIYALYVMFYPQLVAGPIERPYNNAPPVPRAAPLRVRAGHRRPPADALGSVQRRSSLPTASRRWSTPRTAPRWRTAVRGWCWPPTASRSRSTVTSPGIPTSRWARPG